MEEHPVLNQHNKAEYPQASSIVMYTTDDGELQLQVHVENNDVWLSQAQMAALFDTTSQNVTMHIKSVYKEGELMEESTCKDSLQAQLEGKRKVTRKRKIYNLDMVISVGYRVKSRRGVQFRIWANRILKDYLIKGFVVNQAMQLERYEDLKNVVRLMGRTISLQNHLTSDEYEGLFCVIGDYVYALDTLDHYDYQNLPIEKTTSKVSFRATYENAMDVINQLRKRFGGSALFANEKDDSFKSSIGQIYQTFGGVELYPSVEEKAAMLLYLVVKNHSFSDGNKRIAAMLFLWFLYNNGILYGENGQKRIADNTLVAITLMIAESRPSEMEVIVKVVVNLINQNNQ